ncbi:MAG: flagellar biosynthetic protein FliO [Tetrasphaera sp.]
MFLLGGSDHAVTVLAELDPSEVPPPDDRAKTSSPKTFAELLVRARSPAPRPDETL